MTFDVIGAALIIGLLGAGHCIGMCGGIGAALTLAIDKQNRKARIAIITAYNLGRVLSYVLIGTLAAGAASWAQALGFPYFRAIAALLMILMGFYLSGIWRLLTWLEKGGAIIWRYLQPIGSRLMPVKTIRSALLLGAIWGWLPCGLVYTALAYSASQADLMSGALVMFAFGVGTLPAVVSGSVLASSFKYFIQGAGFRYATALAMCVFGAWTFYGAIGHQHHDHGVESHDHHSHKHHH